MRTLSGMILGIALLLAGAYVHDQMNAGTRPDGTVERPMVNWDVVGRNTSNWAGRLKELFNQLTGSKPAPSIDTMEPPRPTTN